MKTLVNNQIKPLDQNISPINTLVYYSWLPDPYSWTLDPCSVTPTFDPKPSDHTPHLRLLLCTSKPILETIPSISNFPCTSIHLWTLKLTDIRSQWVRAQHRSWSHVHLYNLPLKLQSLRSLSICILTIAPRALEPMHSPTGLMCGKVLSCNSDELDAWVLVTEVKCNKYSMIQMHCCLQ